MIGQYAHGNEPSHHVAYLYNYIQKPWKTQKLVREILETQYKIHPTDIVEMRIVDKCLLGIF